MNVHKGEFASRVLVGGSKRATCNHEGTSKLRKQVSSFQEMCLREPDFGIDHVDPREWDGDVENTVRAGQIIAYGILRGEKKGVKFYACARCTTDLEDPRGILPVKLDGSALIPTNVSDYEAFSR